jgi:hypothetical protein
MCCVEGRIRHTSELSLPTPQVHHTDWHNTKVSALMQNIVESGNTNACDGKTSHGISTQESKLSRDVRIYPSQL